MSERLKRSNDWPISHFAKLSIDCANRNGVVCLVTNKGIVACDDDNPGCFAHTLEAQFIVRHDPTRD